MSRDHNTSSDDAMAANLANWNARVPVHAAPGGYDIDSLVNDPNHLSGGVAFDVDRLGDLTGMDVVHLQCHIGTDTLSLTKLGANVTGLDFSPDALDVARATAKRMGVDARFVESDLYGAVEALGTTYDMVYTGIGALNWLPDIARWAKVVAALLKPGGRLHLFEGHPMVYTLAMDSTAENCTVDLPYFETESAMRWESDTTYAGDGKVAQPVMFEWNHGIGETVQAVLDAGLTLTRLEEHRVLPWVMLPWMPVVPGSDDWCEMPPDLRDVVPLSYCLQATKP